MDKSKAIIAVLAFAAGSGAGVAVSQPTARDLKVVNIKLVRSEREDGGVTWNGRACAYATINGQPAEPCWNSPVSAALVAPLEQALVDAK